MGFKLVPVIILFFVTSTQMVSQLTISGRTTIDSIWAPKIYISTISSMYNMYRCSDDMIIGSSAIDTTGQWKISIPQMSEDMLVRLHVSMKDHPAASLIIGGKDENHGFVAIGKNKELKIMESKGGKLIPDFSTFNDDMNERMRFVKRIHRKWDSIDNQTSIQEEKLSLRKASAAELIQYADTCSTILPAIYAAFLADEGFNNREVYHTMSMIRNRLGDHPYLDDFPEIKTSNKLLNWSIYFLLTLLVIWVITRVKKELRIKRQDRLLSTLSPREREVFNRLKNGKTNKEIAGELNVEVSTIKSHTHSIFAKLGITSRSDVHIFRL